MAANATKIVQLRNGGTRRFRPQEERRQIVEETLRPGASVSQVARAHDVNANQVFKWRREYRQGKLQGISASLLPVKGCDVLPQARGADTGRRKSTGRKPGVIDIDLGHARVRIEGMADPDCVRAALEGLVR